MQIVSFHGLIKQTPPTFSRKKKLNYVIPIFAIGSTDDTAKLGILSVCFVDSREQKNVW
jgi:hypothetical protein